LEPLNRGVFKFNDAVDTAVLKPVATLSQETKLEPVDFHD
jgi:phospholipid-binding lipoprotein MlaA